MFICFLSMILSLGSLPHPTFGLGIGRSLLVLHRSHPVPARRAKGTGEMGTEQTRKRDNEPRTRGECRSSRGTLILPPFILFHSRSGLRPKEGDRDESGVVVWSGSCPYGVTPHPLRPHHRPLVLYVHFVAEGAALANDMSEG